MAGLVARGLKGGNGGGDFPKVDWEKIADQVDDGSQSARVSVIIDLGMHKEGLALSDKGFTGFLTEEDAEKWIAEVEKGFASHKLVKDGALTVELADEIEFDLEKTKTLVHKGGEWVVSDEDAEYVVSANVFGGEREYQEIAVIADLVDNMVNYGEDIGEKQYRIVLNGYWDKQIKGFPLKKSAPNQKDGVWTVKSNSKLYELAKSTGCAHLIEVDLDEADWSEMLGKGFNVVITKSGDKNQYIRAGATTPLKKKKGVVEEIEDLEIEPVLITFDTDDVEELKRAFLRHDIIKKIKSATDFAGSPLEKTIEEYEAYLKSQNKGTAKADATDDAEDDDDADEDRKSERKVSKVGGTKGKTKKETPVEQDDQDGQDDDWDE